MNKADLVTALKNQNGFTRHQAEKIVDIFFDTMAGALSKGERVEIRGFGSIFVKSYKSYIGRNPKTGEPVKVAPKKLPFFRCGKELKKRVDIVQGALFTDHEIVVHLSYQSSSYLKGMSCPPAYSDFAVWSKTESPHYKVPAKIKKPAHDRASHKEEQWIVCRKCQKRLTRPSERSTVNGAHQHTFANPSGIVFEIGCFLNVRNCTLVGRPSTDFAWFTGHAWQIVICAGCLTHLGWLFTGGQGHYFYGLIMDRISVESSK